MSSEKKTDYLLEVEHLKQYFPVHQGLSTIPLKAVDDISFAISRARTLGLVGESGCGKTTVGRTLLRLYQPTAGRYVFDGKVLFDSGEQYDENGKLIVDANGKPVYGKKVDVNMMPYRRTDADGIPRSVFLIESTYDGRGHHRESLWMCINSTANRKERREKILEPDGAGRTECRACHALCA